MKLRARIPCSIIDICLMVVLKLVVLSAAGKKDGAVLMIKVGTSVEAHQWSSVDRKWTKVGDVVGSSGGNPAGRSLHEGKVRVCCAPVL